MVRPCQLSFKVINKLWTLDLNTASLLIIQLHLFTRPHRTSNRLSSKQLQTCLDTMPINDLSTLFNLTTGRLANHEGKAFKRHL